jgi:hypothetical protein
MYVHAFIYVCILYVLCCLVDHERVKSLSFYSIVSSFWSMSNIFGYVKCSKQHKGDGLQMAVCILFMGDGVKSRFRVSFYKKYKF